MGLAGDTGFKWLGRTTDPDSEAALEAALLEEAVIMPHQQV